MQGARSQRSEAYFLCTSQRRGLKRNAADGRFLAALEFVLFHHNQHRRNRAFGHADDALHLAESLRRYFGEFCF
jgi:hypothetical protein